MKNIYFELLELAASGASAILVTVVKKEGAGPAETGSKMIVYGNGGISGTVGGGNIERLAVEKARELMKKKTNALQKYNMDNGKNGEETGMLCGGSATLFFEYFAPQRHVYIFGGGHIGKALAYHLRPMNYHVTVIDDREDVLESVSGADEKIHCTFEKALDDRAVQKESYFIIATYQHRYDGEVLKRIYNSDWQPKYIGVVSSRKKKSMLFGEVGKSVPDADFDLSYIPVGLDIGGATPHEIAISIIAEMQAVANHKKVKHLRGNGA